MRARWIVVVKGFQRDGPRLLGWELDFGAPVNHATLAADVAADIRQHRWRLGVGRGDPETFVILDLCLIFIFPLCDTLSLECHRACRSGAQSAAVAIGVTIITIRRCGG